jgi:hypothetical protein
MAASGGAGGEVSVVGAFFGQLGETLSSWGSGAWNSVKLWDNAAVATDYGNLLSSGYGSLGAAYGAVGTAIAENVGLVGAYDAVEGKNKGGDQLGWGQRALSGVTGTFQLAASATGITKAATIGGSFFARPLGGKISRIGDLTGIEKKALQNLWEGAPRSSLPLSTRQQLAEYFSNVARKNPAGSAQSFFNQARADYLLGRGPNPGKSVNEFAKRMGLQVFKRE